LTTLTTILLAIIQHKRSGGIFFGSMTFGMGDIVMIVAGYWWLATG